MTATRVLILGGTTEASALARALADDARFLPLLSLAGRTRSPAPAPVPSRSGGFGGIAGLTLFLQSRGIGTVIDATHPYAAIISANARAACAAAGAALLRIERAPWTPGPGDRWRQVDSMAAAASALGPQPRRVLLTIGRQDLAPFAAAPWHRYVIRSVERPPEDLLPQGAVVVTARGPFAPAEERDLLLRHGIEVIVTKNSGGRATAAKLDAARALGLPVVMLRRPPAPGGETVPDVPGAMDWLWRRHEAERGA